ncbi:hypothetical protein ACLOJK_013629 [Asimina triloba]
MKMLRSEREMRNETRRVMIDREREGGEDKASTVLKRATMTIGEERGRDDEAATTLQRTAEGEGGDGKVAMTLRAVTDGGLRGEREGGRWRKAEVRRGRKRGRR